MLLRSPRRKARDHRQGSALQLSEPYVGWRVPLGRNLGARGDPLSGRRRFGPPAVTLRFTPLGSASQVLFIEFPDHIADLPQGKTVAMVCKCGADLGLPDRWTCDGIWYLARHGKSAGPSHVTDF